MCFLPNKDRLVKIATKDIPVYKVIQKDGSSWLSALVINRKEEKWREGYRYEEIAFPKWATGGTICGNAFHSKASLLGAKNITYTCDKIVRMYIPKGAKYLRNSTDYVSSALVYPKQTGKWKIKKSHRG